MAITLQVLVTRGGRRLDLVATRFHLDRERESRLVPGEYDSNRPGLYTATFPNTAEERLEASKLELQRLGRVLADVGQASSPLSRGLAGLPMAATEPSLAKLALALDRIHSVGQLVRREGVTRRLALGLEREFTRDRLVEVNVSVQDPATAEWVFGDWRTTRDQEGREGLIAWEIDFPLCDHYTIGLGELEWVTSDGRQLSPNVMAGRRLVVSRDGTWRLQHDETAASSGVQPVRLEFALVDRWHNPVLQIVSPLESVSSTHRSSTGAFTGHDARIRLSWYRIFGIGRIRGVVATP